MAIHFIVESKKEFQLYLKYSVAIIEAVKMLPGRSWNGVLKCWTVPLHARHEVEKFCETHKVRIEGAEAPEVTGDIPDLPELTIDIPLKFEPFPYQKQGIAYGLEKKRVIIGDEPGLGKTFQSIATVIGANQFPCVVICLSSLKENWLREWHKYSNRKAMILSDKTKNTWHRYYEMGLIDVFIVNYESLPKYFVESIPKKKHTYKEIIFKKHVSVFKSAIVDESHKCRNFVTRQTKLVKGVCEGKEMILSLTGTPLVNTPADLAPQLWIIDQLQVFGGYKKYMDRYCSGPKKSKNLKELNYYLNLNCFYRREKKNVLKDLPDKIRSIIYCDITTRKEYADAERDLERYLLLYKNSSQEQIDSSMRGEMMVRIGILKNISARGKMNDVREYVDGIIEAGEKIVIFCHLKDIVQELKNFYPEAVTVTGSDNERQKQLSVDAFQNNPDTKIIICSIKAAGVGLTLTASSRVAFIEQPWTAADCDQCEDRCHRIGQYDSVQAMYFLGKNTIDEDIYDIINAKREMAKQVTGTETEIEVNIVDDLLNLFKEKARWN